MVGPGLKVHMLSSHADFVDSEWKPDPYDDSEKYEPVDGYAGENVEWFKITPDMLFRGVFPGCDKRWVLVCLLQTPVRYAVICTASVAMIPESKQCAL